MKDKILIWGLSIILFIIAILIGTLIFWGVGNLAILVFKINYEWTIGHGLICDLIWLLLLGTFNGK